MGSLKIISYNVRGLHSPIKRKKILNQLRQIGCQIAFLQETHLPDLEHEKLKRSWADKIYYSSHKSGRKRGVSILVHRSVNFTATASHKDTEGRFILVNGIIDGIEISLMNVYAPNEDDPVFIKHIYNFLLKNSTGILLMGGDFNCVMSHTLDRQPAPKTPLSRMSRMLNGQSKESGLIDIWRQKFSNCKDFTYYSSRHQSYSRIDYFFTPKSEIHRVVDIKILTITLSDHAPLLMSWDLGHKPTSRLWRLNTSLLNDEKFITFVKSELKFYLETNCTPEISPLVLWDCAKAYIRGRIIAYSSAQKKRKEARQKELEETIKGLEQQHKQALSASSLTPLKEARRELNNLISDKIEGNLRFA